MRETDSEQVLVLPEAPGFSPGSGLTKGQQMVFTQLRVNGVPVEDLGGPAEANDVGTAHGNTDPVHPGFVRIVHWAVTGEKDQQDLPASPGGGPSLADILTYLFTGNEALLDEYKLATFSLVKGKTYVFSVNDKHDHVRSMGSPVADESHTLPVKGRDVVSGTTVAFEGFFVVDNVPPVGQIQSRLASDICRFGSLNTG